MINKAWVHERVRESRYELSAHAEEERQDEDISLEDIEASLLNGEILENYPEDARGPSCLILGYGGGGFPIHAVIGKTTIGDLRVITVYIPNRPKWIDPRTRSRK